MTDWDQLIERADLEPADVKARLNLAAVIHELGVQLELVSADRWRGQCPFHEDGDPSLDVFIDQDTGHQRWGCYPCGINADVFEFIQKLRGCSFPEAFREAVSLLDEGLMHTPGEQRARPAVDLHALWAPNVSARRLGTIAQLLSDRGIPVPAEFVANEFQVAATEEGAVLVPHLWDPEDGRGLQVNAIKKRLPPTWSPPLSVDGSRLVHLYGEWRDKKREGNKEKWEHRRVVVCEGESDTWATAWWLRDDPDTIVLGLPGGAAGRVRPEWVERLKGREVVVLLDGDDAGRTGARKWGQAVRQVRIATLPDGEDAVSAGRDTVLEALGRTLPGSLEVAPLLAVQNGHYARPPRDDGDPVPVSDFILRLQEVVQLEGQDEGVLMRVRLPNGRVADLAHTDIGSDAKLRAWANRYGHRWWGNTKDVQELYGLLMAEAPYVPRLIGTRVAGLHGDSFVLPDLVIGQRSRTYVPPTADVHLEDHVSLRAGPYDGSLLLTLARLHRSDVVTPVLGWVAAAPLRGLLPQFPILGVVGGAGWGKTTLLREILRSFGFGVEVVLTSTTPHAVSSFAGCTNAIPIWFDEYRPGAREDSRAVFDQVLRDAWDGKASVKGGLRENRQELTFLPALAPIVVTGEDAFTETSHLERMVLVQITRDGRNPTALRLVQESEREGLGHAYLTWLRGRLVAGTLPAPPDVYDRPTLSREIARWGYDLLRLFSMEHGYDLPPFDDSQIKAEHTKAGQTNPMAELLAEGFQVEDRAGNYLVWADGDDILVRLQALIQWGKRETDVKLPGGTRACGNLLQQLYPGGEQERTVYGRALRLPGAAAHIS